MAMSVSVFALVLVAAALHATWNAVVKGGDDTTMTTGIVAGSAALLAVAALPFLPAPARASWPFIAASSVFQIIYYVLIARTYRVLDMSQAYPLMRGTAPLLVAISSARLLGEPLAPLAWFGVAVICAGIIGMAVTRRPGQGKGVSMALLNAVIIASYTLIDGAGVRRSGAPAAYTLWLFLLTGAPFAVWVLCSRRAAFGRYVVDHWPLGLVGGLGTVGSYGLALWAMTVAPIAVVAALRESSILFATAISGLVLKEKVGPARIAGACIIAGGAAILRLT
jgi:drug/metabolite transporter (DMT)-like permease